jgi:CubicO group peptidase (beta-lactamase class C family)
MPHDFSRVDAFVAQLMKEVPLAGVALFIAQTGVVLHQRNYGSIDGNTRMAVASASKWVSAAVIATLLDDGTLHLDERASDYIESFAGDKAAITLRQLLSHTSGLPKGESPCVDQPTMTLAECVDEIARLPMDAAPATVFAYGENSFQVAGRMAEVATGKSFEDLFRARLAAPLGMTNSDWGYRSRAPELLRINNPRLGSGLRTTLRDLSRFMLMLSNAGELSGVRVLQSRTVERMFEDHTFGAPIAFSPNLFAGAGYGLSCWRDEADAQGGAIQVSSPGAYGTTPWLDLPRRLGCVFMCRNSYARLAAPTRQLQTLIRESVVNRSRPTPNPSP